MMPITDSQQETLRGVVVDYRSSSLSDGHDGRSNLSIEVKMNSLGQAQVSLATLLALSKLLETDLIYVETNDDMNRAPSCDIFCVGVTASFGSTD